MTEAAVQPVPVPQPPLEPIIGNLRAVDPAQGVVSLINLTRTYGPFFKLKLINREVYFAGSQAIIDELSDEKRFAKQLHSPLRAVRAFGGDGLFTAYNEEPNWAKAHRLLMPAFGPIAIRGMFDEMLDIADQMFTRWERFGPDAVIDVTDNMTRLTLDTIALCAFSTRFNSFYQDEMHPFVGAMVRALQEAGDRGGRLPIVNSLLRSRMRQYEADQAVMRSVAQQLIADRRKDPQADQKRDLLSIMLNGVDPVTGEKLSDENIGYQLVTFLIAGHETTSGLLSFASYLLLKNPAVLEKARKIVDEVLGSELPRAEHLAELRYIEQILMESLRIWPTAPAYAVHPLEDTLVAGKYAVKTTDTILVLIPSLHRDPTVWGDDPEEFRPERFEPENAERLPPNAWKPFGNGARACIGRPFAMQEAQLVLSMLLQRFDFVLDDPSYQLKIHQTLTIKPENLRIRARRRDGRSSPIARASLKPTPQRPMRATKTVPTTGDEVQLLVLHGGNTGSSEAFATRIAGEAADAGFSSTLMSLDEVAGKLPNAGAAIIVTASYEGQPPDNARQFAQYLDGLEPGSLAGLKFAVFGCGNRQWARTYQAFPKRVDAGLERSGAVRVLARGEADSGGDFFGNFEDWYASLWSSLAEAFGRKLDEPVQAPSIEVEFTRGGRESALRLGEHQLGVVIENRELVDMSKPGARSKRHLAIQLPQGQTYRSGDYLAVLGRNRSEVVQRALRRFGLTHDTEVLLKSQNSHASTLPTDRPLPIGEILSSYVELNQPITRSQVALVASKASCPPEAAELQKLANVDYEAAVLAKRVSALDLLERYQSVQLGLGEFLSMLPSMRARQYSISSSPLWSADQVTLTIAVVDAPALSGSGHYVGVASGMLAEAQPGDRLSVAVRPSNARFHPPSDPKVPMVLICAGSGIAPFRGFLQERALQKQGGQEVGPSVLFFGVDAADVDFLYREEFAEWERLGVVEVLPAFSATPSEGVQFVQDRVWKERRRVAELFEAGAMVFLCGDGQRMAPAVRAALINIYREASGVSEEAAQAWADEVEHERGRFVSDVFA